MTGPGLGCAEPLVCFRAAVRGPRSHGRRDPGAAAAAPAAPPQEEKLNYKSKLMDNLPNSYLFDPAQVPSPGYVNEVSSCKLEESNTIKLKDNPSSEVLVHKNALQSGGLKRTESRGRTAGLPHQGPLLQEDTGGGHCAEKPSVAVNGVSPTTTLQPTRSPRSSQGDSSSSASTTDSTHPTQPFFEGRDARKQDCVPPASETQVIRCGDSRAPSQAEGLALAEPDCVLQIPAPDYPQLWGLEVDSVDHEEEDCLFKNQREDESLPGTHPRVEEHDLNMSFPMKRSWDSLNEAVTMEVLSVSFKEEGPAHSMPEDSHDSNGDGSGDMADEDAAVAEALAALEAATAGEDVDEAD